MSGKEVNVILVGAKSIGQYGGYESFINKLLEYHKDKKNLHYFVYCKANGSGYMNISKLPGAKAVNETEFTYYNARGFLLHVPQIGAAQAIYYDVKALSEACKLIKREQLKNPIVYIMACRIGPFMNHFVKKIHALGGKVYLNPDGHEWMRAKWSAPVRKYWKESERMMVKYADLSICDSKNIEKYIQKEYAGYKPKTTFIAYGSETTPSTMKNDDPKYISWLNEHGLREGEFYISVGRFVPENNFETMIREFMKSHSTKDFAIITTKDEKFLNALDEKLHFSKDKRIKFVGTVYDQELLKKIRERAYGYFHGHSVGGTNPSLLEALGSTKLNLLYDVGFNREVAEDGALYWMLEDGNLAKLIDQSDSMSEEELEKMGQKAKQRIKDEYSWQYICDKYTKVWEKN
jgi:rhamnosyltransferase